MALLSLQILTETIQRQEVILNKLHDITFYGHPKEEPNVTVDSPQYHQPTTTTFPKYQLNPFNKSKYDTGYLNTSRLLGVRYSDYKFLPFKQ